MDWIRQKIANRLGGALFDQEKAYKFAVIKQLKQAFIEKHPDVVLLDFGIGEPDGLPPMCAIKSLQESCALSTYNGYADNGASFFVQSVQNYLQNIFGISSITKAEILPVLGIKSGLSLLAGTLINPGDVVAYTVPGYGVFATQAKYFGGELYPLELKASNNFLPDLDAIPEKIRQNIKVVCINYPNNPTGAVATKEFFEKIVAFAKNYQWIILQDAAYSALSFEQPLSIFQVKGALDCCVELHSLSKGFNMTGWRIGWLCGNKTVLSACAQYKNNCDSGQFLAIQKAAATALDNAETWLPKLRQKYNNRLQHLRQILEKHHFKTYPSKAGFFLYTDAPKHVLDSSGNHLQSFDSAQTCAHWLLEQLGIVVVDWDDSGSYLRFSVTFKAEDDTAFLQGLDERLKKFILKYDSYN